MFDKVSEKKTAIRNATNYIRSNTAFVNSLALTVDGPHAEANEHLARCILDAQRSADAADMASAEQCDELNLLLQLDADIRAIDEARADLEATVDDCNDYMFRVSFYAAAFAAATKALEAAPAEAVADCYAARFVPARDAFLDAALQLAERTVSDADNIVERLLNNV